MKEITDKFLLSRVILSPEECDIIKNFVLDNEEKIKSLGPDSYFGEKADSLTGRFLYYNILKTDIGPMLIPKLRSIFEEHGLEYPIYVQCWANTFRPGKGIHVHKHGDLTEHFISSNIFICGPTKPGTTYYLDNQFVDFENTPGEIHFFGSNVYHYVSKNKSDEIRISIALDVHPNLQDFSLLEDTHKSRYYKFE